MRRAIRIGAILLLAALLVGAGVLVVQRRSGSAVAEDAAPTATVTRGSIEEMVSATGNVAAELTSTLAFASSGSIAEVLVEEGQAVGAGEVLARLDTAALEWQVARARAALDTAQARLRQAQQPPGQEELASAQAAVDSARANYDRVLAGPKPEDLASAQAALDSARAQYRRVAAGASQEELAAAQAALDSARAALQQAQASYDRVKNRADVQMLPESLNLQNATIEMERAQANYDAIKNRPTAEELAAAEAQVAQAEAQLAQLQEQPGSDLAAAEAQVAQAEAQLAQLLGRPAAEDVAVAQAQVEEAAVALAQAQAQLDDALIVAPFAGSVLAVQVQAGEWATPGAPAIVLATTEALVLDVSVDEVDVAQIAVGQVAHLTLDALRGEELTGTVTYIAPASTNVGGAVAYQVKIGFAPDGIPVRLGMTADVEIVVASAEDALLVPNRAITADRQAGRYYVTRPVAGGGAEVTPTEQVEVRIGLRDTANTQVLEGLAEGEQVVLPQLPEQDSESNGFGGRGPFGGRPGGGQ